MTQIACYLTAIWPMVPQLMLLFQIEWRARRARIQSL